MSASVNPELRFPNGHSIPQVKRNAKRLSKVESIPLNMALDKSARHALGLPDSHIHWAEAVRALEVSREICSPASRLYDPEKDTIVSIETAEMFKSSIVVALDIKDAMSFDGRDLWLEDIALSALVYPSVLALIAHTYAEEENRKIPTDEEWDGAKGHAFDYHLFKYTGSDTFKNTKAIIQKIVDMNHFCPIAVWEKGMMTFDL